MAEHWLLHRKVRSLNESDGLLSNLGAETEAQLRDTSVDIGYGRTRTMYDLILGWAAHVRKFKKELTASRLATPYVWNEHDYVAALFVRDFVDAGLSQLSEELSIVVGELISPIDSEYVSFTQGGYRNMLARVAGIDTNSRGWWWDRIPTSGPVLDELNRHYK